MRRKFLAVLLVIALMFSSVVPSFAVASVDQEDSGSDVVFWVEDVTVEPGATEAKVKLHVSGGADKWATSTLFVGTPEGVLATSYAAGDYIDDPALDLGDGYALENNASAEAMGVYNNATTGAQLDFSGSAVWNHILSYYRDGNSNSNYPDAEGVIVEFTYSLPADAAAGTVYPVELLADAVYDINSQAVSYKTLGGEIKVSAADPLKLSADVKTVEQYDEFTYSVKADENPGFWGMSFVLGFDAAALELVSASSSVFGEVTVNEREDGALGVVVENSEFTDVTATGSIIDFTFKANTIGEFPVTVSFTDEANVITADEKVVPVEVTSGSVTVAACSHSETHVERTEPTATEDGVSIVICDKCGEEVSRTILPSIKEASITAAAVTVEKGDEFDYAITLDTAIFGVWGLHFDVKFDATALELVGVESDNFNVDDSAVVVTADGIKLTLDRDVFENVLAPATIVTLKFKAVAEGTFDVNLSAAEDGVIDINENVVAVSFVNGVITVDPCTHPSTTEDRLEPTDTEDGYVKQICDKCGEVVDEVILPHEKTATISGATVTVEKGDEFEYAISMDATTYGVWGLHFDVKFDTTAVEYVGYTTGVGFSNDDATVVVTADGLKITLDRDVLENVTELGALITLKFKANAEGTVDVELSATEGNIIGADEKPVDTTFVNGVITVDPCTHGSTTHIDRVEPTDTVDGYERVICDKCGEIVSEIILPSARQATISAETKTVELGDEFDYVINLDSTTRGVWGLHFDVKFDTTAVEYVGFTAGAGFNSDDVTVVTTADGLKITLDRDVLENVTDPGALITLKFKANAEGTVDVELSAAEGNIIGADEKPVDTTFVNGVITVALCTHNSTTTIDRVEPTETEDGYERVICDKCGETVSEKVLPATGKVIISAENMTVEFCDEFDYVVSLDSSNRGVWGVKFDVKFDSTVLEYVGFESNLFNSGDATVVVTEDGLKVTLNNSALENISADSALITLKFKAVAEGSTDVTVIVPEAGVVDVDENVVDADVVNGSVTVDPCSHPSITEDRVEPTDTEDGYVKYICDKCGKVVDEKVLPYQRTGSIGGSIPVVEIGGEFDYLISLDSIKGGVWGLHFDVKFDSNALEYIGFQANRFKDGDAIVVVTEDGLKITLVNGAFENITELGTLITLKFKAIAEGTAKVTIVVPEDGIIDVDENIVKVNVFNGYVIVNGCSHSGSTHIERVEPTETTYGYVVVVCDKCGEIVDKHYLRGDAELDGDVDTSDLCLVKRYSVGNVEFNETQFTAADADKNGKISARDLLLIKRHIIGVIDLGYID